MSWWKWGKLFPRILKVAHVSRYEQEKSKDELWKLYHETDSISYRAVILSRLLILRLKYFESKIAESENYPHEVDWDDFGDEMFELLAMSEDLISTIITRSEVMEEFLKPDHIKELWKLEELKRQIKQKITMDNKVITELNDSEDEKIRKALINTVRYYHPGESPYFFGIPQEKIIDYLEKQKRS